MKTRRLETKGGGPVQAKQRVALKPYQFQSPEIAKTVAGLRAKFGKYALPDVEARKIVDKAMGSRTLTEELYAMREA